MTGLEALFVFYMFANLMNMDTINTAQDARIEQLESELAEMNRIQVLSDEIVGTK